MPSFVLAIELHRLLNAAAVDAPEQLEGLTRELWTRLWGGGGDIAGEQVGKTTAVFTTATNSVSLLLPWCCADVETGEPLGCDLSMMVSLGVP